MQTTDKKNKIQCGSAEDYQQDVNPPLEILRIIVIEMLQEEDYYQVLLKLLATSRIFAPMVLQYFKPVMDQYKDYKMHHSICVGITERYAREGFMGSFMGGSLRERLAKEVETELAAFSMLKMLGRRCRFARLTVGDECFEVQLACNYPDIYRKNLTFVLLEATGVDSTSNEYVACVGKKIKWYRDVVTTAPSEMFDAILGSQYENGEDPDHTLMLSNACRILRDVGHESINTYGEYIEAFCQWLLGKGMSDLMVDYLKENVYRELYRIMPLRERMRLNNDSIKMNHSIDTTLIGNTPYHHSRSFRSLFISMGARLDEIMQRFEEYAALEK